MNNIEQQPTTEALPEASEPMNPLGRVALAISEFGGSATLAAVLGAGVITSLVAGGVVTVALERAKRQKT